MSALFRSSELSDGRVVVHIGTCAGGGSEASDYVESLLEKSGIQVFILGGSRVYEFGVWEADATRAVDLLRSDPRREYYNIRVYEG